MTTLTLEQAYEACQNNKTTWLNHKTELVEAEQEYREGLITGDVHSPGACKRCTILST